jgi:hypothetical protein
MKVKTGVGGRKHDDTKQHLKIKVVDYFVSKNGIITT